MEIQYNVIRATGIRSFVNIHSRTSGNKRQVCFARAIGSCADLAEELKDIDSLMGSSPAHVYKRITKFSPLNDLAEVDTYISKYDRLGSDDPRLLSSISDRSVNKELAQSCVSVCDTVRQAYPGHTDTVCRNLAVSLLFWADRYLSDFLDRRQDHFCKFICSGKIGYREYAFCCLAAMMGVDVLILLPEGDLDLPKLLLDRSAAFTVGKPGKPDIPEYSLQTVPPQPAASRTNTPQTTAPRTAPRTPQSAAPQTSSQPAARPIPAPAPRITAPKADRKELSYEELAGLAESVVMIEVHDNTGDIFAGGSGIAINSGGYILTNCHVIAGGAFYTVRLENDPDIYAAPCVIKYHPQMDLAILKIERQTKPLQIYSDIAELQRGQKVIAIGSPLGLFNSVSDGIISGFRTIRDIEMIQFTAPISSGSSGGALLNMYGELIGISTAGIDGGQNINLAVTYKQIRSFAENFL